MTDTALERLYSDRILALSSGLADDLPLPGAMDGAMGTATLDSPLCGSQVTARIGVTDGAVSAWGHRARACALGRAATAILAQVAPGRTLVELRDVRDRMEGMLRGGGPPPDGLWADLAILAPARDHRARHASIMLPFRAVVRAFENALEPGNP